MLNRSNNSNMRRAPITPNSPREIMLGDFALKDPNQIDIASKSKVRQTVCVDSTNISSLPLVVLASNIGFWRLHSYI